MELKIAPNDVQSMSQDGDSILRSLQNKSIPMIDLLVRESLQNSLDATKEGQENTIVEFSTGEFSTPDLSSHFEGISQTLEKKYRKYNTFMAIKDSNTSGLTGDYKSESQKQLDQSNFHKLVFGIGKNQDKAGAGGSWGLGKTSYFRVGIGIVIYYTRILTKSGYEERLIASLIESPKNKERILPESERGIAWWGEYDHLGEKIYPITDEAKINDVLEIFGIDQYTEDETGTTIIIPYLNLEHINDSNNLLPWELDYEDTIKIAVKRWYSPRLANNIYRERISNSMLQCTVNGEILFLEEPVFKKMQTLYNSALTGVSQEKDIQVKKVYLPRRGMADNKTEVGAIAFCEVNREDMEMMPPFNRPSPLGYLGLNGVDGQFDSKVIAYSRMPGMIVEYDLNGDWSPRGNVIAEEHILLGFFVPNSFGELYHKYAEIGYKNLESYLRATENADHANWVDEDGITIIKRTKGYVSKEIQEYYQVLDGDSYSSATSVLSRKFGNILMPPRNFGKASNKRVNKPGQPTRKLTTKRTTSVNILRTNFLDSNSIKVTFSALLKSETDNTISLLVSTQEKKMDIEAWKKAMEEVVPYPFTIKKASISRVEENANSVAQNRPAVEITGNSKYHVNLSCISSSDMEVEGEILLEVNSNQYIPSMTISSNNKSKEDN